MLPSGDKNSSLRSFFAAIAITRGIFLKFCEKEVIEKVGVMKTMVKSIERERGRVNKRRQLVW